MIDKLFGKYATVLGLIAIFCVGGLSALGLLDDDAAKVLLAAIGVHAATSKGLVGGN